jgi:hypothetical protein
LAVFALLIANVPLPLFERRGAMDDVRCYRRSIVRVKGHAWMRSICTSVLRNCNPV